MGKTRLICPPTRADLSVFFANTGWTSSNPCGLGWILGIKIFCCGYPPHPDRTCPSIKGKEKNPKPIPPSLSSQTLSLAPCSLSPELPLSLSVLSPSSSLIVSLLLVSLASRTKRFEFFFFSLSLFRSLSSTLSFVLFSFLIGLDLWLFVDLSICGFEGDGGVRVGFVGLREMAGR